MAPDAGVHLLLAGVDGDVVALVLAHGGTAGLLVESLILVAPIVILCLYMLATRKPRKREEPAQAEADGEVDR